jgi:DNA-binding NtrC family response regulator
VNATRRILLIDDTPEIAQLLTFALRDRGYDVVSTGFTDTVGDMVVEERADALVLDCSVFEMSASLLISDGDSGEHRRLTNTYHLPLTNYQLKTCLPGAWTTGNTWNTR